VGGFGGKGATLAEGLLYSGDPAQYAKDLAIAAPTPEKVKAAVELAGPPGADAGRDAGQAHAKRRPAWRLGR
jgi:hypothetical protein